MVLSVRMYEAANDYGPLEQFDVDPATATVMDIMRRVRKSTALHNRHVRVGMRLHTYADHVPGDLINDTEKDPLVLSATLDELQQSGCVEYEEGRHGLHLKVLVDGCRTAEEVAEFTLEHSWRMEYEHAAQARELAALTREVEELKEERDVAVRLARAALGSDVYESESCVDSDEKSPRSSFMRLVSDVTVSAADRGDLCALRVLYNRLLRRSANSVYGAANTEEYVPIVDCIGLTLVHRTARFGDIDTVRMLVEECGADVNAGEGECTPLHLACMNGFADTVRVLMDEFDAYVDAEDETGATALHLAFTSTYGCDDMVRTLIEFGADINMPDQCGHTPLHLASMYGYTDLVRSLIEFGADASIKDDRGRTPLQLASNNGHIDVVELLITSSA